MLRLTVLLGLCLLTACFEENFKPCEVELSSQAFIDLQISSDSLQIGDEVTLVMDYFPQDENGRVLVLPLDFRLRWDVWLYREGSNFSDTLLYAATADQGVLEEIGTYKLSVLSSRSVNRQQAQIRFRVTKAGNYSMNFSTHNTQDVELDKWGECNHKVVFRGFKIAPNSVRANKTNAFSFYVKP
jgi:hypothetical protein